MKSDKPYNRNKSATRRHAAIFKTLFGCLPLVVVAFIGPVETSRAAGQVVAWEVTEQNLQVTQLISGRSPPVFNLALPSGRTGRFSLGDSTGGAKPTFHPD